VGVELLYPEMNFVDFLVINIESRVVEESDVYNVPNLPIPDQRQLIINLMNYFSGKQSQVESIPMTLL
jgi:hypothetical protein